MTRHPITLRPWQIAAALKNRLRLIVQVHVAKFQDITHCDTARA